MTPTQALQQHQDLCNELHQLALEENSYLLQHQRVPDSAFLERKKALLARLDETLSALRAAPRNSADNASLRGALDKTRSRILQILQLDKENEQLLLRFSLTNPNSGKGNVTAPSASILNKIYQRHS
jgi:hypothetical protein